MTANFITINKKSTLYNGDCEEVLKTLDDGSIDLIVTSPPYNVDLGDNKYNKNPYDMYYDNKDHIAYLSWLKNIFWRAHIKLKKGGRVAINIGDGKNGRVPTHSDIIQFMTQDLHYLPMANIIWRKNTAGNRCSWGSYIAPS